MITLHSPLAFHVTLGYGFNMNDRNANKGACGAHRQRREILTKAEIHHFLVSSLRRIVVANTPA
jgi:hypothetical protein